MLTFQEYLEEKLIMYNNGAKYGQVAFVVGGGASGKGFAITNFIDSYSFRVLDVDKLKTNLLAYRSYKRAKYQYPELATLDLRNPKDVALLHKFVSDKGWDKAFVYNIINSINSGNTLPNLMFDVTMKNVKKMNEYVAALIEVGYQPHNIHITWVLTNYAVAVVNNRDPKRGRIVPEDILLTTHEGAALTMMDIVRNGTPHGVDGSVSVILNNKEETERYNDQPILLRTNSGELVFDKDTGEPIETFLIKDFTYITIKYPGSPIISVPDIKKKLYGWILNNVPKTVKTDVANRME